MKGHGINHSTICLLHFTICFEIDSVHNRCTRFIHFTSFWYHIRWFTPYFFHFPTMLVSKQRHNQYLYEYLRISPGLVSRGGIPKSKAMCILRPLWYSKMILPGGWYQLSFPQVPPPHPGQQNVVRQNVSLTYWVGMDDMFKIQSDVYWS